MRRSKCRCAVRNTHHTKRDRILYDVKRTLLWRQAHSIGTRTHIQHRPLPDVLDIRSFRNFTFIWIKKNGLAECKCKEAIAVVQRATVTLNLRYCVSTFLAIRQGNANVRCAHECNLSVRARTSYRHCLPQECSWCAQRPANLSGLFLGRFR